MNPADKVEKWDITRLTPYARNSRTHSDEQISQIAASIKEWGWTTPVLVDEDGSIIAGHARTLAAQRLKMTQVPVMVAKGWSDAKKRAYVIADNKLALNAGWDEELLKLELQDMSDIEQIATGFTPEELNLLFNGWQSDIERMDNIDAIDSAAKEKIIIKCSQEEHKMLREKITNLIDDLGLHNVEVE